MDIIMRKLAISVKHHYDVIISEHIDQDLQAVNDYLKKLQSLCLEICYERTMIDKETT